VKRPQRHGPPPAARDEQPEPQVAPERHSGEGLASVLEVLQKLEPRPEPAKPPEPAS
jgi:hypothetical protein